MRMSEDALGCAVGWRSTEFTEDSLSLISEITLALFRLVYLCFFSHSGNKNLFELFSVNCGDLLKFGHFFVIFCSG